jgi:hypothetical protein
MYLLLHFSWLNEFITIKSFAMEKKLSKSEELAKLSSFVSGSSQLDNHQWDFIYDMVIAYPEDARSLLEDHHTRFYDQYFRKYFEVYDKEPELFDKYRNFPQLINKLPQDKIEIIDKEVYALPPNPVAKAKFKLSIIYNASFRFEAELSAGPSFMVLRVISPLDGVVSNSSSVPPYANPFSNGYMRPNGVLRQRGYDHLIKMIDEVYYIMKVIKKDPAFALGLYTIVYDEARQANDKTEYGKIKTNLYNLYYINRWANKMANQRFGVSLRFPDDMVESIQRVLNLNPELFENRDN